MGTKSPNSGIILSCFLILACSLSLFSDAADTLTQGQSIKDGETLISDGKVFELGFFSPGNSTNRYVGIWHYNLPTKSVVWVANRDNPLTDSSGIFTLQKDGNLVVFDGSQNVKWSSNSSVVSTNSLAQLMDSGDLVLNSSDGSSSSATVLWESFDHPTDTFLPGMKLIVDQKTGKSLHYISWKSPDDPNYGNYSFSLDPHGSAQIFIWEGSKPRWRSGQWNGGTFIGAGLRPLNLYGWKLTTDARNQGKLIFTFQHFNNSLLKFVMQWNGSEKSSILVNETKEWRQVYLKPSTECEIYNKCGKNAKCTDTDSPICSCLSGFEPKFNEEWSNGSWSGGCIRITPLKCERNSSTSSAKEGKEDGFLKLETLKLPDLSDWASLVVDASGCKDACLKNCSCKAYAYVSGIGCMIWGNYLIDIQQFSGGGQELYLKLAGSELGKESNIFVIVLMSVLGFIFLCISVYLWWHFKAKIKGCWEKRRKREDLFTNLNSGMKFQQEFSGSAEFGEESKEGKGSELTLFQFKCIISATNNFSDINKLGEGGFGPVYKGSLPCGQEIAVKRLSKNSGQGLEEFKNEVTLIARLQHRNLVRLLGYCIQGDEQILVYEYMPNKSLDAFLFDPTMKALLDWRKRFNIIEGIARGVLYLHRDSRLRIVHRDLKASNILLDDEMNPKISDFGMARIFGGNQDEANTNRVVGTIGYLSPEYAMQGLFSEKSDVYSFGVLVLETVSSHKNKNFCSSWNTPNLLGHAWRLWKEDKFLEFVDPSLCDSLSTDEILRCIQIGLLCVQDRTSDRPTMSSVVSMLGNETSISLMPKQPTFTIERSPSVTESSWHAHDSSSTNELSFSGASGR